MHSKQIRLKQIDFDTLVGFLYFSISNLSRMFLLIFGVRREITYALFIVALALYFLKHANRIEMIDTIYYLILTPIIVIGLVNYGNYIDSSSRFYAVILLFYPSYLFIKTYNKEMMQKVFIASQYYAAIYLLIYYLTTVRYMSKYSLDYGYWIIVPILTFIYEYILNKKPFYLIFALILAITLIFAGNRGPVVLGALCIVYLYLTSPRAGASKKNVVRIVALCILLVVMALSFNYLLSIVQNYSGQSRTLQKLLNGSLLESATRERLYSKVVALIEDNRFGYGPLASRKLLNGYPYPHSLIYEMQLDYGMLIGTLFSILIIVFGLHNLYHYRNSDMRLVVGYIEIVGLGSLFVSSSYFYEIYVPATIALFVDARLNKGTRTDTRRKHHKTNNDSGVRNRTITDQYR